MLSCFRYGQLVAPTPMVHRNA